MSHYSGVLYIRLYKNNQIIQEGRQLTSIAAQLRPTVASWYKATRLIAMVGLLSVLLYVGIRIIISSTAADKAKYKKMLMDWLTALCMLFILHYLMVFILTISKQITGIISTGGDKPEVDALMSNIRQIASMDEVYDPLYVFGSTIMYLSLVILTVIFTFQYLRRVLYMAFLTMIAPLIALTYPLDKIKDGQAQAFTMWIREYIFNALIQPIHLLIYVMLVGSANDLTDVSPIYAIVAISFIVPAEKFLRKMFGFEKASTVSQLGAAAGGAMIMNMINKAKTMGAKGGKEGSGGSGGSKPVRTATSNGGSSGDVQSGGGASSVNGRSRNNNSGGDSYKEEQMRMDLGEDDSSESDLAASGTSGSLFNNNSNRINARGKRSFGRKIGGTANAIGKKYKLWGSGAPKQWGKRIAGLYGAAALGTIGLAAGVATGDLGNAAKYAGAGILAGKAAGEGLVGKGSELVDTALEGGMGEEAYNNMKFDHKFYNSNDYLQLKQKYKNHKELHNYTQTLLNAGITDASKMDKAIGAGLSANDAVQYNKMSKLCPSDVAGDVRKFRTWYRQTFGDSAGLDVDEIYNNMRIF